MGATALRTGLSEAPLFVGLGSNRGDRHRHLSRARRALQARAGVLRASSVRETEPVGVDTDRPFLNQVVCLRGLPMGVPRAALEWLMDLEGRLGRDRTDGSPDRVIDLDLLYWGRAVHPSDPVLPHPRLHRRRFVLEPLVELNPDFVHPLLGQSQRELLRDLEAGGGA